MHDTQIAANGGVPVPTSAEAFDQASTPARNGDYRAAVRSLYLSALLWLDEQDLLRYDRALTNREYLERAQRNPALLVRLMPVIETLAFSSSLSLPVRGEHRRRLRTFPAHTRVRRLEHLCFTNGRAHWGMMYAALSIVPSGLPTAMHCW